MNHEFTPDLRTWPQSEFEPHDERAVHYLLNHWEFGGRAHAWEYTGWRDETQSWKQTAYIHAHLNPSPTTKISGPDALTFLQSICVNSFQKFKVGAARHAILTDDFGKVGAHGILTRIAEDEFISYWLSPYLDYRATQFEHLDFELDYLTGEVFLFQVGGPKSLEILEEATGENLHDIEFLRHRTAVIDGAEVTILRIGMAATLSYEVHGPVELAQKIYQTIYDAGLPFGIRKLGTYAYMCEHTEGGFGQAFYHFPLAWGPQEPGIYEFMKMVGFDFGDVTYMGSVGDDVPRRLASPYQLGWGHLVNFNHDFPGKAALEKEAAANAETMVTLVWNAEDVSDVVTSELRGGPAYTPMIIPIDFMYQVGTTSGRTFTLWSQETISLAWIATDLAIEGTELTVLWGDVGSEQKEIRATVARFPYLVDPVRNEHYDVSTIPSKFPAKRG
jgi:glycine cleavage system aminomethyltransferase T